MKPSTIWLMILSRVLPVKLGRAICSLLEWKGVRLNFSSRLMKWQQTETLGFYPTDQPQSCEEPKLISLGHLHLCLT